ncbi:hypothetical protein, partial [Nostoc linckia]
GELAHTDGDNFQPIRKHRAGAAAAGEVRKTFDEVFLRSWRILTATISSQSENTAPVLRLRVRSEKPLMKSFFRLFSCDIFKLSVEGAGA